MKNTKTKQFNPAWLTPVSSQDLKHTRGIQVADFINTFCVQTKDTVAGRAGERIVLREWQVELLKHIFAVEQNVARLIVAPEFGPPIDKKPLG